MFSDNLSGSMNLGSKNLYESIDYFLSSAVISWTIPFLVCTVTSFYNHKPVNIH